MERPKNIEKLIQILTRLPGVGPRQAARFAYWLVDSEITTKDELIEVFSSLRNIKRCNFCFRTHEEKEMLCARCRDTSYDRTQLVVLGKDVDLDTFEKSGIYNGHYYILGGSLSALNAEDKNRIRIRELYERIKTSREINEVILATNFTIEGEFTARYIEKILEPLQKIRPFKITRLGRGLSTGAELEYAGRETLKNALDNRK